MRTAFYRFSVSLCVLALAAAAHAASPGRGGGFGGSSFGGSGGAMTSPGSPYGGSTFGSSRFDSSSSMYDDFGSRNRVRNTYQNGSPSPENRARTETAVRQRETTQERALGQRLDRAEALRERSAANGNPRLGEAADRMEQNAQERYAGQGQRIEAFQNRVATQNRQREVPPYMTGAGQPWTAPTSPPAMAKKPTFLDRVKGLWPFR